MELLQRTTPKFLNLFSKEYIQLSLIYTIAFLLPILVKQPQYLLGIAINCLLIFSVSKYEIKKILPILVLPSLASYLNGLLLGSATTFLLYLLPFISISNLILVYTYKAIKVKYLNILLAPIFKVGFLYTITLVLVSNTILPQIFLTTMGLIQLITALTGTILASLLLSKRK